MTTEKPTLGRIATAMGFVIVLNLLIAITLGLLVRLLHNVAPFGEARVLPVIAFAVAACSMFFVVIKRARAWFDWVMELGR